MDTPDRTTVAEHMGEIEQTAELSRDRDEDHVYASNVF